MARRELPIPPHFNPDRVGEVWRVPYQQLAENARQWARQHSIPPISADGLTITLMLVDVQNTFCIPEFELYVGGHTGTAAVDDNRRLCEFIYRNLGLITRICPTMDTHQIMQIFHSIFLVNDKGEHPPPFTLVSAEEIDQGAWKFNPEIAQTLGVSQTYGQNHLHHYAHTLKKGGKYDLTIWPYHAMLGGIGHALVSAVEEAVFFHSIARCTQPDFQVKGDNPFTENYSVLSPEVLEDAEGKAIAERGSAFIKKTLESEVVVIAGQAKSHCVVWTIEDLLEDILASDAKLAEKVYLVEDCSSPIVIPGVIDYTDLANEAFQRFADAGMHVVRSTDPISTWPGVDL